MFFILFFFRVLSLCSLYLYFQFGNGLDLDSNDSWAVIELNSTCFASLDSCSAGVTISFWLTTLAQTPETVMLIGNTDPFFLFAAYSIIFS